MKKYVSQKCIKINKSVFNGNVGLLKSMLIYTEYLVGAIWVEQLVLDFSELL